MLTRAFYGPVWRVVMGLLVCLALPGVAQQAPKPDADLIREGPLGLEGQQIFPCRGCKVSSIIPACQHSRTDTE
jgi:hypothetical protein